MNSDECNKGMRDIYDGVHRCRVNWVIGPSRRREFRQEARAIMRTAFVLWFKSRKGPFND